MKSQEFWQNLFALLVHYAVYLSKSFGESLLSLWLKELFLQ